MHRLEVAAILAKERLTEHAADDEADSLEASATIESDGASTVSETADFDDAELVATPSQEDSDDAVPPVGVEVYIGDDVELDTPMMWTPADGRHVPNPHLMIMGESGSGKTYAAQALVAELSNAGIPSVIFDYGHSFELEDLDKNFLKFCKPKEHRIGEEGVALNPLEILESDVRGPNQVATRIADVFDAVFQLGNIQKKVLLDAMIELYRDAGILQEQSSSWRNPPPNIRSLQDTIDHLAADKSYLNYRNAAGLSARLTPFFMLTSFTNAKWSWDSLLLDAETRVQILQFRGLEGKTQRVLVELLLWHMFFHLKSKGQEPLRVFCILDEAHHLSFREQGPLTALLREARKFGLGIVFASQQPEDFSPVAYSNSASKLVFQTADPKLKVSRFLAGKATNFDRPEEIRDTIEGLVRGDALFISAGRGHVVRIADFPHRSTLWRTH